MKERTRAFLRTLLKGKLQLEEVGADGPPYESPLPFRLGIAKEMRDLIMGARKIAVASIENVTAGKPSGEGTWTGGGALSEDLLLTLNLRQSADGPRRIVLRATNIEEFKLFHTTIDGVLHDNQCLQKFHFS